MTRRRNLILGVAEAMTWSEIEPFVVSLRETGCTDEVVFFVAGLDERTEAALGRAGVQVRPMRTLALPWHDGRVEPYDPRLARLHPVYSRAVRGASRLSRDPTLAAARLAAPISVRDVRRFFLYHRYLWARQSTYANVMLADVRDVVFQGDPFVFDLEDALHCFLEDERQPIGAQPHNRKWVRTAFGDDALRALADRPVVCAGVTIGPCPRVLHYLRVMTEFLVRLRTQRTGLDQAVHNYVIHHGLVPGARLVPNGTPLVSTLGTVPDEDVDALLRAAVLHQYDRHDALAARLRRRFSATREASPAEPRATKRPSVPGS